MLLPKQRLPADVQKLVEHYSALGEEDKLTLLSFAEFLAQRAGQAAMVDATPVSIHPEPIPRPESESVVAAIKRLSASYHMLDRAALLTETSTLMTAHIMHGRDATEVIDELEALFQRHHQAWMEERNE